MDSLVTRQLSLLKLYEYVEPRLKKIGSYCIKCYNYVSETLSLDVKHKSEKKLTLQCVLW